MTFLISVYLSLTPKTDVILPPMTSKVVKSFLALKNLNLDLSEANRKPYQITPLKLDGNYLYARKGSPGLNTLRRGKTVSCRVSFATKEVKPEFLTEMGGDVSTPYGDFVVVPNKFEMVGLDELSITYTRFTLRFMTPTLLTNLYMLPPQVKRRFRAMNRLIPQPSLLLSSLTSLWNSLADPKEMILLRDKETSPYYLGRMADLVMMETGYNIRPETALIGKSEDGKIRETRGFTGWVRYELTGPTRIVKNIKRLLALASYLGVGRSRGLGFGVVQVEEEKGEWDRERDGRGINGNPRGAT